MSWIRSALKRALIAPKPRGSRQFAAAADADREGGGGDGPLRPRRRRAPELARGGDADTGAGRLEPAGGGEGSAEAVGLLMLAMSTLLYRSGRRQDAMEKLKATQQVASSAALSVAAWEALMGLHMEAGQEMSYLISPNDSIDLSIKDDSKWSDQDHLKIRVNAIRGLVALLNGETESAAQLFVDGCRDFSGGENQTQNAAISYGEYLHCVGDYQMAGQVYEKILETFCMDDMSGNLLAAGNMVPEEASLGATCSYGQLLSHSGKFDEAEDYLTRALQKAEEIFGANHPKVGVILTCIARMYKLKAKSEGSTSIMVQEGLYRKALEVLKAPVINSEGTSKQLGWRDIISLARGEYAELLLIQSNRKAEGERMRLWAEDAWRNRRLTLAQALEFSEPSKPTLVVDTRIGRVV